MGGETRQEPRTWGDGTTGLGSAQCRRRSPWRQVSRGVRCSDSVGWGGGRLADLGREVPRRNITAGTQDLLPDPWGDRERGSELETTQGS